MENHAPSSASAAPGRVASLHLHPVASGGPFSEVSSVELVPGQGIRGNPRYFNRGSRRQVTLIEREIIAEHAAVLDADLFAPGAVRSNVETEGVSLMQWLDCEVQVGEALLLFYAPRTPCHKMDQLLPGLRARMENGRQGVLAQVLQGGRVQTGDSIKLVKARTNS